MLNQYNQIEERQRQINARQDFMQAHDNFIEACQRVVQAETAHLNMSFACQKIFSDYDRALQERDEAQREYQVVYADPLSPLSSKQHFALVFQEAEEYLLQCM